MTSSHPFISFSSEGQQHSQYVFNKRPLWSLTRTVEVEGDFFFVKANWYAVKTEMLTLQRHPVGRFPLKGVSSFFLMPTLTYSKQICRGVQNLAGSLADLGKEWCCAAHFGRCIFPQRMGGKGDGATPLAYLTLEWLCLLTSHPGGKAAAVAGCSAATPVIVVCMNKISSDGVNLPNPLHQMFARVGGIFSIIYRTTGVFPRRSVMNDVNDDCGVVALWCVLLHA